MASTRNKLNNAFGGLSITPVSDDASVVAGSVTTTVIQPSLALGGGIPNLQETGVNVPTNNLPIQSNPTPPIEPTLPLQREIRRNGITVRTATTFRPDLLSLTDYKPIYSTDNEGALTNFGTYMSDLYKSSVLRDTIRRYTLARADQARLGPILTSINNTINASISTTQNTIANLDILINLFNQMKNALNVRSVLEDIRQTEPTAPLLKLPNFYTNRMLFSSEAYNSFSDTKLMYQLIADLTNIMSLCSFNLLDSFQDLERLQSPVDAPVGSVVDPITIDTTYGTGLRYTPRVINRVTINNSSQYSNVLNALPVGNGNRIKFLVNLLSKEYRVSHALGTTESLAITLLRTFFGFGDRGNPFTAINGIVPNDIFLAPNGANSLTSLFYSSIEGNAVVLPFEAGEVAGDGETVFIPGTEYFGDGILNNNFANFTSYRDDFSTIYTNVQTAYEKLLLTPERSKVYLSQTNLFRDIITQFSLSQEQFRENGVNSDSTSVLIYSLFVLGAGNTRLKYETFKLLLLLIVLSTRNSEDFNSRNFKNEYGSLLFSELTNILSANNLSNLSELYTIINEQVATVKEIFIESLLNNPNATASAEVSQIIVALNQFDTMVNSMSETVTAPNLFKGINQVAESLFYTAAVSDQQKQHLIPGSSFTRFNSLSVSGTLLLIYEIFSCLAQQFTQSFSIVTQLQYTQSNLDIRFRLNKTTVKNFLTNSLNLNNLSEEEIATVNNILVSYENKLKEEDQIVKNILEFFRLLNSNFSNIQIPENIDLTQLRENGISNQSLGYIRTTKNSLKSFTDKIAINRDGFNGIPNFSYYLPSGKNVSRSNWTATTIALKDPKFRSLNNQKIISVGIPTGFLNSVLNARLSRNSVRDKLNLETSDVVNVNIYKLSKNDDRLIYNPISFKFDMSLFAYGFDGVFPTQTETTLLSILNIVRDEVPITYQNLIERFKFYDFDESVSYRNVAAKTLNGYQGSPSLFADPFYRNNRALGTEVVTNLYTSFILDNYLNLLTGLSFIEDTFIQYTPEEITAFKTAMQEYRSGDVTKLGQTKFMTNPYQQLLNLFQDADQKKLMLTLCNDIPKTVLRPKLYERVFHMVVDVNNFSININQTERRQGGAQYLENLRATKKITESNGMFYKQNESFDISQYFINVEVIQ